MSDSGSKPDNRGGSTFSRLLRWLFVGGNRLGITGGLLVAVFLLTWGLISMDVLTVGPRSSVKTMFGSGIVAGVFTLITVTLSINQLISTRVFGAPNTLSSKYEGEEKLRRTVESFADHEVSPVSPAEFISLIGRLLHERVKKVGASTVRDRQSSDEEMEAYISDLGQYASDIRSVSESMHPMSVIMTVEGDDYAQYVCETERLQRTRADHLSKDVTEHLDAINELLRALSVSRQYFKTMTIQQEFAQLSRLLIFVSIPAVLTAIYAPLLYQSGPDTLIAAQYLPLVLSGAIAVVLTPLVLLLVFLLRITTVMRYTVSVGRFSAPSKWPWSE